MSQETKIQLSLRTGVPLLLWGPPGVGKTRTVEGIAQGMGLHCETVIASIRDPQDFGGLPVLVKREWLMWAEGLAKVDGVPSWMQDLAKKVVEGARNYDDGVRLEAPSWAKRLAREGKGVLFIDEITTAPPAVQAALLRVVLDRVVGDLQLPPTVRIMAAANPVELAAGGWDLSAPLANRFRHMNFSVDASDWSRNFISYWGAPPKIDGIKEEHWMQARSLVASYIRAQQHKLLVIPREESAQGGAYPTPRSWDAASRALALLVESGEDHSDLVTDMIAGDVGDGAALEFVEWRRALDLPDPEDLLNRPESFKVPRRSDQLFAILASVVVCALRHVTQEKDFEIVKRKWLAAWRVLGIAANAGSADVASAAAVTLRDERKKNPTLPLPIDDLKPFVPMLKAANLI